MISSYYTYSQYSSRNIVALINVFSLKFVFAAPIRSINFVNQFEQMQIVGALISNEDQRKVFQEFQKEIPWIVSHMEYLRKV